jgi:formylglycine-generating enzyme required for sulfatase activity/Tol biopolymer transport system component
MIGAGSILLSSRDLRLMAFVPGGSFLMGAADSDANADADEKPQHEVQLDAFWVDIYEVTNEEYAVCVQAGACNAPAELDLNGFPYAYAKEIENAPVVNVTWYDAKAYCTWAGKRLLTEAEWEKAARGEDARIYPWGNDADASRRAWYCNGCIYNASDPSVRDDFSRPVAVGSFPDGASFYGVYDMAGNVSEWVYDWYDNTIYQQPGQVNPAGPDDGSYRVIRGGSWTNPSVSLRTTYRQASGPMANWIDVGFRCAMEDDRTQLLYQGQPTLTPTPTQTFTPTPTVPTRTPVNTPSMTPTLPPPTALPDTLPLYQLVYLAADGRITVVNSDGSNTTPLTEAEQGFSSPAWSPTRNIIAMFGPGEHVQAVYTIKPDGSGLRKVFDLPIGKIAVMGGSVNVESYDHLDGLRWSPDGSRLLFYAVFKDSYSGKTMFTLNIVGAYGDGFAMRPFTFDASWSPTNNQVVFASSNEDVTASWIVKQHVSLADEGSLLSGYYSGIHVQPDWSPDGRKIVFVVDNDNGFGLDIVNADGSNWHSLLTGEMGVKGGTCPAWSPGREEIAFISGSSIYAIHPDGQGLRLIVADLSGKVSELEWSPDGTRLAFVVAQDGAYKLEVIRADGAGLVEVASDLVEPFSLNLMSDLSAPPQWSPLP